MQIVGCGLHTGSAQVYERRTHFEHGLTAMYGIPPPSFLLLPRHAAACPVVRENDLVLLEIKINGELATPLSVICHRWGLYSVPTLYSTGNACHSWSVVVGAVLAMPAFEPNGC